MRLIPVLVILGAITGIGLYDNQAFADPGNTAFADIFPQGGVQFDVIDPDGIQSVELISAPGQLNEINANCDDPQIISSTFNFGPASGGFDTTNTYEITDCQSPPSTSTWEIMASSSGDDTAVCTDNCGPTPPCNVLIEPTIALLQQDPNNCVMADDKVFKNFRNYSGCDEFEEIRVRPAFIGDEKGLEFRNQGCLNVNVNAFSMDPNVGVGFDFDVISLGTPIIDNTLTSDTFFVTDSRDSPNTRAQISEQVHPDLDQFEDPIAFKQIFKDGFGAELLSDHRDFAPQQSISVNVDIGLSAETFGDGEDSSVRINGFFMTFSQEPEPRQPVVGGEFLSIDATTLLLAAAQSPSALLTSLTIAALGIGAYVFSRNQNNIRNIKAILQDYLDRF